MSQSSTATAPKNPTALPRRSAWAKGTPQAETTPSPRSQSSAPSTPKHKTHSRRPSALGQGIPVKGAVSVPRSNIGAVSHPSFSGQSGAPGLSIAVPLAKPKIDVKKLFLAPISDGAGPSSQGGQNESPAGLSSPRLGPHPHPTQQPSPTGPSPMQPQMQPQIHQHKPMAWGGYYQYPNLEQQHYQMYPTWYPPIPMQTPHGRPPHPGPHIASMSSRAPADPPTPLFSTAASTPITVLATVPQAKPKVDVKKMFQNYPPASPTDQSSETSPSIQNSRLPSHSPQGLVYKQDGSPGMPNKRPVSIRIESEAHHKKRLAEEAKAIDYQDGADPEEPPSPAASTFRGEIHNESTDEQSDIAAIKRHVRSLVKRMQCRDANTQELAANYVNFPITDEEDRNIIAIINLIITKEEAT